MGGSCFKIRDLVGAGHVEKRFTNDEECFSRKALLDAQIDLMHVLIDQLNKHNITYWLHGGSLLGSVRNGRIIPYDKDGDIGVLRESLQQICKTKFTLPDKRYVFEVYGCVNKPSGTRDKPLPGRLVDTNIGIYVDIFEHTTDIVYVSDDNKPSQKNKGKENEKKLSCMPSVCFGGCKNCQRVFPFVRYFSVPIDWVFPLSKCTLEGKETFCPNQSEEVLRYFYGNAYMKPDKPSLLRWYELNDN